MTSIFAAIIVFRSTITSNKKKADGTPIKEEKLEGSYVLEIPASNQNLENIEYYIKIAAEYDVTLKFTEEYPDEFE